MPRVPFTAFFSGPLAVYTSSTGQQDPITGAQYLGTDFQSNYYADLSNDDVKLWNNQFGTTLHGGRYRIVQLNTAATAADLFSNGPVGWSFGTSVQSVTFLAGSGYTSGTYNISSTFSAGQVAAVAQVVVGATGTIISANIVSGGSGFLVSAIPTFALTALGAGSGGSVVAQLSTTGGEVTSYDATAISATALVRGILITNPPPTAAQVLAGAWIVIQESGIANVLVTSGAVAAGSQAIGVTGGTVTVQASAYSAAEIGHTLDPSVVGETIRVVLTLPMLPF